MSHITHVKAPPPRFHLRKHMPGLELPAIEAALSEMGHALVLDDTGATLVLEDGQRVPLSEGDDGRFSLEIERTEIGVTSVDFNNLRRFSERFGQLYAVHRATLEAQSRGFSVVREVDASGTIRLTLDAPMSGALEIA